MEIPLTAERQAQLADLARRQGRDPASLADEALGAYLDHARWLEEAVEEGREAARRRELVDHQDVGRTLEQRYRSE